MKSDAEIKEDVLDELAWQPNIDETEIGVIVENGIVTLSGVVNQYSKKIAAEKAVKSVEGVKAIAGDIEVKYGDDFKKTDKEIAKAVVDALEWNSSVPEENLTIKVEDGWLYFIHGWTQVIAQVLHIEIDAPLLAHLMQAAESVR